MTNGMVSMRPFVVLAIRVMGPGPRRVEMVKLAHAMSDGRAASRPSHSRLHLAPTRIAAHSAHSAPSQRAA